MSGISKLKQFLYTQKRQEPEPETSETSYLSIDEGKFN